MLTPSACVIFGLSPCYSTAEHFQAFSLATFLKVRILKLQRKSILYSTTLCVGVDLIERYR
jgi:hypothetical protein